jgi:NADPH:quinone reductase-like Zn-dependent oxidoreductase
MKAVQITKYGGPEIATVVETDMPVAGEGQVLVEVYASSINPFDVKIRQGHLSFLQPPLILGGDIAGVVAAIGSGVSHVAVGDKVFGQANTVGGNSGAFAEFAVTKADEVAKMPATLDFVHAAVAPLAGLSALQAIVDHLHVQPGQKVLVHGGAGGVGTIAIQLAKHLGASVATTARADDHDYVRGLGADEVIDYQNQRFEEILHDYDAVLDTVGGDTYKRSFMVLKKGGAIVSALEKPDRALMEQYGVQATAFQVRTTLESLNMLTKLIDDGAIGVNVGKTFPLADIRQAFEAYEHGHIRGKVSIVVKAA